MKLRNIILAVFLLTIISSLSGCSPKVWIYDFVEEGSLARGDEIWRPINNHASFASGLILDEDDAGAPHYYNGDFTVKVDFDLNTSANQTTYVELYLSSGEGSNPEWHGGMYISGAGSATSKLQIYYHTPSTGFHYPDSFTIASLLSEIGNNTMTIEKVGGVLRFLINDELLSTSLSIVGYDGDTFCPYIGCFSYDVDECTFKKVTIEYKGDQILID